MRFDTTRTGTAHCAHGFVQISRLRLWQLLLLCAKWTVSCPWSLFSWGRARGGVFRWTCREPLVLIHTFERHHSELHWTVDSTHVILFE